MLVATKPKLFFAIECDDTQESIDRITKLSSKVTNLKQIKDNLFKINDTEVKLSSKDILVVVDNKVELYDKELIELYYTIMES